MGNRRQRRTSLVGDREPGEVLYAGGYLNGPPPPDQAGNPLRMLLEDWHARTENLYTTDPDTETLRTLIRGHSRAAAWCDDVTRPI